MGLLRFYPRIPFALALGVCQCKYLNINYSFDAGEDEHAAYLMGWLVDKVCDAYHKFKKEEEK